MSTDENENAGKLAANRAVFREDFADNEFLVEKGLTEQTARKLVEACEARKHHQHSGHVRFRISRLVM